MILARMRTASGSEIGQKFWPREGQSSDFNADQAEFFFKFYLLPGHVLTRHYKISVL